MLALDTYAPASANDGCGSTVAPAANRRSSTRSPDRPGGRRSRLVRALARALVVGLIAWAAGAASAQSALRVVVTLPPWADLVGRVAGEHATVTTLLPAGASPHAYDPSPRTLATVARAELIVVNGGIDAWALELVEASGTDATVVVLLDTPGLDLRTIEAHDEHGAHDGAGDPADDRTDEADDENAHADGHADADVDARAADDHGADEHGADEHGADGGGVNPHVWLDPERVRRLLPVIVEALSMVAPERRADFEARGAQLDDELARLTDELRALLAPIEGAPLIPFHDAWPYFAERFGLDLVLEIEPFPGREPTPRVLAEVLDAIATSGAPAIFAEAQLGDRAARVLAAEAGVGVAVLDPLGGREGRRTYEELLRYNAATILDTMRAWTAPTP